MIYRLQIYVEFTCNDTIYILQYCLFNYPFCLSLTLSILWCVHDSKWALLIYFMFFYTYNYSILNRQLRMRWWAIKSNRFYNTLWDDETWIEGLKVWYLSTCNILTLMSCNSRAIQKINHNITYLFRIWLIVQLVRNRPQSQDFSYDFILLCLSFTKYESTYVLFLWQKTTITTHGKVCI